MTIGEIAFYTSLNAEGAIDVPLAPDGKRDLSIGYEHRGTGRAGFITCRYDGDSVPAVCYDIADSLRETRKCCAREPSRQSAQLESATIEISKDTSATSRDNAANQIVRLLVARASRLFVWSAMSRSVVLMFSRCARR